MGMGMTGVIGSMGIMTATVTATTIIEPAQRDYNPWPSAN